MFCLVIEEFSKHKLYQKRTLIKSNNGLIIFHPIPESKQNLEDYSVVKQSDVIVNSTNILNLKK